MTNESKNTGGKRIGKSKSKSISFKQNPTNNAEIPKKKKASRKNQEGDIRLNKYIANSGMCSRREADLYITTGNVMVNGKVVNELGYKVKLTDEVVFDGRKINPEKKEYVLLNKPKGFDVSRKEDSLHKSALSLVANASKYQLYPVGSMQRASTGLLLFTNDHDVIKKLTDSGLKISTLYQVSLDKNLSYEDFLKIKQNPVISGREVKIQAIEYVENLPKSEIGIQLDSNRNNIVLKIFKSLGYEVIKLDRVTYGGLSKKDLPRGRWRHLTKQEQINLGIF